MKRLMEGFRNNGMTRKQWFYGLLSLVIVPPILTVLLYLVSR